MVPTRVLATLVEVHHDERGIVWPRAVAPFAVHLVSLGEDKKVIASAKKIYLELMKKGVEILWDDREISPGAKFADADLIGAPLRIVVSEKTLAAKRIEVKERGKDKPRLVAEKDLLKLV